MTYPNFLFDILYDMARRTRLIQMRATEEEWRAVKKVSKGRGITVAEWIREKIAEVSGEVLEKEEEAVEEVGDEGMEPWLSR